MVPARPHVLGEGSPTKSVLGEVLRPHASVMASAATTEKILARVILHADKEKVEKLTFDQVVTKFLHVLGQQGIVWDLHSLFAVRILPRAPLINKLLQNLLSWRWSERAIELEGVVAEANTKGKKVIEEVEAKNKKMARLEARVAELEKSQNLAKGRIIAAFKESDDFQEAMIGLASSYFGDRFYFYKRQLAHHYPNLGIDLDDIEMDHDFLAKEGAEAEERERKAAEERGEKEERWKK